MDAKVGNEPDGGVCCGGVRTLQGFKTRHAPLGGEASGAKASHYVCHEGPSKAAIMCTKSALIIAPLSRLSHGFVRALRGFKTRHAPQGGKPQVPRRAVVWWRCMCCGWVSGPDEAERAVNGRGKKGGMGS